VGNQGSVFTGKRANDGTHGLLSRVYLDWGSNPLTYDQVNAIKDQTKDPAPTYTASRLEKAVEYANKVTGYSLNRSFASIWGKDNEAAKDEKTIKGKEVCAPRLSFEDTISLYNDNKKQMFWRIITL
jgi:hypothetical protein